MFLHQMISTFTPRWKCSDTDLLLSTQTPKRLPGKVGPGILLSDVLVVGRCKDSEQYISDMAVRGLIKRNQKICRNRSILVLLLTQHDTIPVTVIFGTEAGKLEPQIREKEKDCPVSLLAGLMDYLSQRCAELQETP